MFSATKGKAFPFHEPFIQILKCRHVDHAAANSVKYSLGQNKLPDSLRVGGSNERQWKECQADNGQEASTVRETPAGLEDEGREEVHEALEA